MLINTLENLVSQIQSKCALLRTASIIQWLQNDKKITNSTCKLYSNNFHPPSYKRADGSNRHKSSLILGTLPSNNLRLSRFHTI
ncbi:unnamed protein product [Allacma fusca]|uniref:Uncharacterized protein n=1 Tax=Allacma fusca TaxID=39272 RepID=A0A8J2K3H7_9HEXA|nr:unnamed protein product [Allacma fusca]